MNLIRLQNERGGIMGDKGKKDREKNQKQKTKKKVALAEKAKTKQGKNQKDSPLG
jgi:hypothetical protein